MLNGNGVCMRETIGHNGYQLFRRVLHEALKNIEMSKSNGNDGNCAIGREEAMAKTKVVNIRIHSYHDRDPHYFYIGRPSLYGNPFTHHQMLSELIIVPTQEDAVIAFREWLYGQKYPYLEQTRRIKILQNLKELEGKLLGCYCEPAPCHGNVYIDMLEGGYDITIKGKRYIRESQLADNTERSNRRKE